jgi:hypothetical protein
MAPRFRISLAEPCDDAALRQRMAEDRMQGDIVLSFRREPDYYLGCKVQGETSQIIKCTDDDTGKIVGLTARHRSRVFINGRETQVGYLSDLRVDPAVRRGTLLARGYRFVRELHDADPLPFYYSVILQGNVQAIATLVGARAGLPIYEDRGKIHTPAIHLDRRLPDVSCSGVKVRRGTPTMMPPVFEFLRREFPNKQFAPCYRVEDLGSGRLHGLLPEDFYIAVRGETIVGCIAAWDQTAFRQAHVEQYSNRLRIVRPMYNLAAHFTSLHSLPPPGSQIRFLYLSLIAVENNHVDVFACLMRHAYQDRRAGECHFMIAGLHEQDPLYAILDDYRKIDVGGRLFLIYWPEQSDCVARLDNRIPYVEMAAV